MRCVTYFGGKSSIHENSSSHSLRLARRIHNLRNLLERLPDPLTFFFPSPCFAPRTIPDQDQFPRPHHPRRSPCLRRARPKTTEPPQCLQQNAHSHPRRLYPGYHRPRRPRITSHTFAHIGLFQCCRVVVGRVVVLNNKFVITGTTI